MCRTIDQSSSSPVGAARQGFAHVAPKELAKLSPRLAINISSLRDCAGAFDKELNNWLANRTHN